MRPHPFIELHRLGQSVWLDQMRRALLTGGTLDRLIREDGVRGLTSNPTIFEKAIGGSNDYDEALRRLAAEGRTADEIYDALVLDDIGQAADLFRPLYDASDGFDGFVSLEISPALADDTEGTLQAATRLSAALNRPNVMLKIPATAAGLPAIEEAIAAGINVNVTLILARHVYQQVADAYIRGLERRVQNGQPVEHLVSVASFFVSRIDTVIDEEVERRIPNAANDGERAALRALLGQTAIANAKLAYQDFKARFGGERFARLRARGARPQRPLWASTGTKNPQYSDVLYVESLIGPDTVTTLPPATLQAFLDHGRVRLTLDEGVEQAQAHMGRLAALGISLDAATARLREEGVAAFAQSFTQLIRAIEARRDGVTRCVIERQTADLGDYEAPIAVGLAQMEQDGLVSRLWKRDATIWKQEPSHQEVIKNALGWLSVVESMADRTAELKTFAADVRDEGFEHAVMLGMGGSSLCSEVLRTAFSKSQGFLELHVLDSTVPDAVGRLEAHIDLEKTLFIVASKSGTTTEPRMFHRYFYERVRAAKGTHTGGSFIAITDSGTALVADAQRDRFRRVFLNPSDIGGRYSALSYFGMVPAALMGLDLDALLDRALHAVHACADVVPARENPGARLAAVLGTLARLGRDKLTLVIPPPFESLGLWIEQLVAESTGKDSAGIVPVVGEALGRPDDYGSDRLFVYVGTSDGVNGQTEGSMALRRLAEAGHPVLRYMLHDRLDLGEAFFVWEFAIALAGALLRINAFDQPNVQESKDNTRRLLQEYAMGGTFAAPAQVPDVRLSATTAAAGAGKELPADLAIAQNALRAHLAGIHPGDYVALMAYLAPTAEHDDLLRRIQRALRDRLRVAVTTGYGPRFLHSTGQLHKGGPDTGVFIQITADDEHDLAIPGERFTFGVLTQAQALGDLESLKKHGRRVIRIRIGSNTHEGLTRLLELCDASVAPTRE